MLLEQRAVCGVEGAALGSGIHVEPTQRHMRGNKSKKSADLNKSKIRVNKSKKHDLQFSLFPGIMHLKYISYCPFL